MYQKQTDNRPLAVIVEDKVMDYIVNTPLEIGDKIPNEFELAELFGVGRSTIREAVKSLASKGVFEVRRGDGTYVTGRNKLEDDPLGLSKFTDQYQLALDLCDVRLMLEPEIAMRACEHITEEQKVRLKQLCDEIEEAYVYGFHDLDKDIAFHAYIAKCSQNGVIERIIPIIQSAVIAFINVVEGKLRKETIQTHRDITNAILRQDGPGAKYAMIMHLNYNRQMIIEKQEQKLREES